jgi:hypothetical protein
MFFSLARKNTASDSISLSTLLRGCIVAFIILACILCYLQYSLDFKFYANVWTYILIVAFCIFLYHFSGAGERQYENSMRLGVGLLVLLFFLQNIFLLMSFPFAFTGFLKLGLYSIHEFNKAILIFGLLLFVFYLGIRAAALFPSKGKPVTKPFLPNLTKVKTALYIVAYSSLLITLYLGREMGWVMGTNWESGWIIRLFPTALYTYMLALLWMWYGKTLPKRDRIIIAGFFILLVVSGLAQGSRSGIFTVLIIFLVTGIVLHGNFKIPKRLLKIIFAAGLAIGPFIWMLGTSIRSTKEWKVSLDFMDIISTIVPISMRLGSPTSNFIMVINDWGSEKVASLLTLSNLIKIGINGFVPGDLFDTPFYNAGNLWELFMYAEPIGLRVMGETWSGFGFYYILCGYWVILVVFLYAWISTLILRFLINRKTFFSSLIAIYFFLIHIYDFFNRGTLDDAVTDSLLNGSYILIFYFILILIVGATAREKTA